MKVANLVRKLFQVILAGDRLWLASLRKGVAAGVEHNSVLKYLDCNTVIDVGGNRGQFALAARHHFPEATIVSFEPLAAPAGIFRDIFASDRKVVQHVAAIGPESGSREIHVSGHDDSSSLLPISELQEENFPGTAAVETAQVRIGPLDEFLDATDIAAPAMLKLDVQGFELDALRGCEKLLANFEWVYCECSFVELYIGQNLAADVIDWLAARGFRLTRIYNFSNDRNGQAVQADFLFRRVT